MDCQSIKEYLYQFIDGQLDNQNSLLVKEHLYSCPLCNLEWREEKKMDSLIRQNILKERAPFALKEVIINRIEGFQKVRVFLVPRLMPVLALLLAALLMIVIPAVVRRTRPFPIFTESISNHIKFLQGGLPVEIASSNPQDIRDWFQGKLDFAISIPDLSNNGINLVGARLCHIKDRKVAYIMYEKNGHYISAFMIDTKGLNIPKAKRINMGKKIFFVKSEKDYQSLLCMKKEKYIGCVFVSDLPEDELMKMIMMNIIT